MDKHWNSMSINKLISILLRQDTETLIMQIENIPKTAVDDLPLATNISAILTLLITNRF